jgi:hypothetical protein
MIAFVEDGQNKRGDRVVENDGYDHADLNLVHCSLSAFRLWKGSKSYVCQLATASNCGHIALNL